MIDYISQGQDEFFDFAVDMENYFGVIPSSVIFYNTDKFDISVGVNSCVMLIL